jgi:hypothetical protein
VPRTVDIRLVPPPLDPAAARTTRNLVLAFLSRLIAVAAHHRVVAGSQPRCCRVPT